jgi:dihydrofolate reductase
MSIVLVVAVAENGVIGRNGRLPWRMPTDLKRFRKVTMGKPVIMGRKTYESIGKPLDGRDNIVITRQQNFAAPGVHVVASVEAALALARKLAGERKVDEIAVIGGAEICRAALPIADRIYLTVVKGRPEGDTVLEPFDTALWRETSREALPRSANDQFPADFVVLDRAH